MTPITINCFVAQAAGNASGPGQSAKTVSISNTRPINSAAVDPNSSLFAVQGQGGVNLNLQGIAKAIYDQLPDGAAVQIIIQDIPAAAPAAGLAPA